MEDKRKIVIIGADKIDDKLLSARMIELYGKDVILMTPEQARNEGISPSQIIEDSYEFTARPNIIEPVTLKFETGRDKRRERRKQERKKH
jgi:hypothetical protein